MIDFHQQDHDVLGRIFPNGIPFEVGQIYGRAMHVQQSCFMIQGPLGVTLIPLLAAVGLLPEQPRVEQQHDYVNWGAQPQGTAVELNMGNAWVPGVYVGLLEGVPVVETETEAGFARAEAHPSNIRLAQYQPVAGYINPAQSQASMLPPQPQVQPQQQRQLHQNAIVEEPDELHDLGELQPTYGPNEPILVQTTKGGPRNAVFIKPHDTDPTYAIVKIDEPGAKQTRFRARYENISPRDVPQQMPQQPMQQGMQPGQMQPAPMQHQPNQVAPNLTPADLNQPAPVVQVDQEELANQQRRDGVVRQMAAS